MLPVLVALAAAATVGTGAALQQHAASQEDTHAVLHPGLLLRLLRRRAWLLGVAVSMAGYGLQVTALTLGGLGLVEPVLTTHVAFALVVSARRSAVAPSRRDWTALGTAVAGVAAFLVLAAPAQGEQHRTSGSWPAVLAVLAVVIVVVATRAPRLALHTRALVVAATAGVAFGMSDALIVLTSDVVGRAGADTLTSWPPYAWALVSLTAFMLQQNAYHSAHLAASLPATSALQPVAGVLLGAALLGETVRGGWAIPLEVAAAALLLGGVIALARSPLVTAEPALDPQ